MIERIPAFPKPLRIPTKPNRWLDREEQLRALLSLPAYDQPIYSFMMLTGCRVMEAAALQWEDVRKDMIVLGRTIDRRSQLQDRPKDGEARALPMTREIEALFASIRRRPMVSIAGYVFLNQWGRQYSYEYLRSTWHRACDEAGLESIALKNATRHSWGMQRVGKFDQWLLAKVLGHSDLKMTENYVQAQPEHLRVLFE